MLLMTPVFALAAAPPLRLYAPREYYDLHLHPARHLHWSTGCCEKTIFPISGDCRIRSPRLLMAADLRDTMAVVLKASLPCGIMTVRGPRTIAASVQVNEILMNFSMVASREPWSILQFLSMM